MTIEGADVDGTAGTASRATDVEPRHLGEHGGPDVGRPHPLAPPRARHSIPRRHAPLRRGQPSRPLFPACTREARLSRGEAHQGDRSGRETRPSDAVAVVSYDEKPGIHAIANAAPDLPPEPGRLATFGRDHAYKHYGTVSLLGGIDLLPAKFTPSSGTAIAAANSSNFSSSSTLPI